MTVDGNSAGASGGGGNVYVAGGSASATDSILAHGKLETGAGGENCAGTSLTSGGFNIEDRNQCNLVALGDQINTDPLLGALAGNGATTQTEMLLPGSPALDTGDPAGCKDPNGAPLASDQRGVARPAGHAVRHRRLRVRAAARQHRGRERDLHGRSDPERERLRSRPPRWRDLLPVRDHPRIRLADAAAAARRRRRRQPGRRRGRRVRTRHRRSFPGGRHEPGWNDFGADQAFTTTTPPKHAGAGAPVLANASQTHRVWRRGHAAARISRASKRPPVGTVFSFSLNEPARVSLKFSRRLSGRKVGRACVPVTSRNRGRHRCTRLVSAGALAFSGHAATNKVAFQGRLAGSKQLKPGSYSVTITAADSAGKRSAPVSLSFTIVK